MVRQEGSMISPDFTVCHEDNPELRVNELFPAFENLDDPAFQRLRERYDLDAVVSGIADEFDRILALRHWIHESIRIEDDNPTRVVHQYAFDILDAALDGGGFHCAHFSIVQSAILNAYGYICRRLGAGDGRRERGRYHGVNEVWVNELTKWVLIDAKYDLHFEKDGLPLSALEMRDEVLKNEAADVQRSYGPQREYRQKDFPEATETYRWVNWELDTNRFSAFPCHGSSSAVLLDDDYSLNHTWYRDGKPNWAYAKNFFIHTPHRGWIEWTPNVISSKCRIEEHVACIRLHSCTPNFATYQMSVDKGSWTDCADILELDIPERGMSLSFRAVNKAGVCGPQHRLQINMEEAGS